MVLRHLRPDHLRPGARTQLLGDERTSPRQMRVRTAVSITAAIIIAQGAVTWFAAKAWLAIPECHLPPNRWHIELGNFSEALAAFAAAGAALIALWIAGRDRRDRKKGRLDGEKTVARLVRLDVEGIDGRPVLLVKVRNFGPLPILDVTATDASWIEHPNARCPITRHGRDAVSSKQSILRPWQNDLKYEEMIEFEIQFLHPAEDKTLVPQIEKRVPGGTMTLYKRVDPSKVVAKIQFTTASGIRWETLTNGAGTGETARL